MRRPPRRTTPQEVEMARAMRARGRSTAVIACDLDRSEGWVEKYAPPLKTPRQRHHERMQRAHALRLEGKSRMEVAGMLGFTSERILSVSLSRYRAQHMPESSGRYPSMHSREPTKRRKGGVYQNWRDDRKAKGLKANARRVYPGADW